jgi:penicillin-binding protein-related factor A (putative recombinase)
MKRSKRLESEISKMLSTHPEIAFFYRPYDVPPAQRDRFTNQSPIDFYCYMQGGRGLVVECKSLKGKSLPFSRFPDHQWTALEKCSQGGVLTYVLVNYYGFAGREGQRGRVWAIPFSLLAEFRAQTERKSWPIALFETCDELRKVAQAWEWAINEIPEIG